MPVRPYRQDQHEDFVREFVDPANDDADELRRSLRTVPGGGREDPWANVEGDLLQAIGDARDEAALPIRPRDPSKPIEWTPVNDETLHRDDVIELKEQLVQEEGNRRRRAP